MKKISLFTAGKNLSGCRYYAKKVTEKKSDKYVPWNMIEVTKNILETAKNPYPPPRTLPVPKMISETNPANHQLSDVGKFYTIPEKDKNRLFTIGGIPKPYKKLVQCFGEFQILVRNPAVEIMDYMKRANPLKPTIRYVVYGRPGSGKTVVLNHIMHYAASNGYIIFHVPWVMDWLAYRTKEACLSEFREGQVDIPLEAALLLKNFQLQNADLLKTSELVTSKEYVWNQRESTPAGSPLNTLVSHGINRIKYACQVIDCLLNELKIIATEQRCKVLIAIDGFNAIYNPNTFLKVQDKTKVTGLRISVVQSLLNAIKPDWSNGAVVLVVSRRAVPMKDRGDGDFPFYLLKKQGFEHVDPFIPIEVPALTEYEFNNLLDYYEYKRWIHKSEGRDELEFITCNLPGELMSYCRKL